MPKAVTAAVLAAGFPFMRRVTLPDPSDLPSSEVLPRLEGRARLLLCSISPENRHNRSITLSKATCLAGVGED